MIERVFAAKDEALYDVLEFVEEELQKAGCPMKHMIATKIALEEVFVNVAHYAYDDSIGEVSFSIDFDSERRQMTFQMKDSGVPFNPLLRSDPDITMKIEERPIGGLGIFMMKQTMDDVNYSYIDGKNVLTMKKNI